LSLISPPWRTAQPSLLPIPEQQMLSKKLVLDDQ